MTASLSFAPAEITARVLIMAIAVCGYAACGIRVTVSLATAVTAWLFGTGFLVNGAGELSFGGSDLLRLGLLVVAALGGSTYAATRRAAGRRLRRSSEIAATEPGRPGDGDHDQHDQRRHGELGGRKPWRLRERRDLQDRRAACSSLTANSRPRVVEAMIAVGRGSGPYLKWAAQAVFAEPGRLT
ncbi:hypothetical protein ACFQX6_39210 [Streptosporangium lutulentum]